MAGVPLPIVTIRLQACVTEPLKPFLDKVIVSATLHVYVNQTDKGELVLRRGDRSLPVLHACRVLCPRWSRWHLYAGICFRNCTVCACCGNGRDLRYDAGLRSHHRRRRAGENFYMDVGWGTYGFKAASDRRQMHGRVDRHRQTPKLIEPFSPARFETGQLVGEKAAAAVSLTEIGGNYDDR